MIGYSKEIPAVFGQKNGKVVHRYNVEPVVVELEGGAMETQYRFEQDEHAPPVDTSVGGVKRLLKAVAARKRWEKEVGGMVWDGHAIHTDRESQSKIVAAYVAAKDGVRTDPSGWKTPAGYLILSNAEVIEMALTVLAHIQASYDAENALAEEIDACATIDELKVLPVAM